MTKEAFYKKYTQYVASGYGLLGPGIRFKSEPKKTFMALPLILETASTNNVDFEKEIVTVVLYYTKPDAKSMAESHSIECYLPLAEALEFSGFNLKDK